MKNNVLFLGAMSKSLESMDPAASFAGTSVQLNIIDAVTDYKHLNVQSVALDERVTWPKGAFLIKKEMCNNIMFPGFINLPFLKQICFSLQVLLYILTFRPNVIMQYNGNFTMNLVVVCYCFFQRCKSIIIIQDYRVGEGFSFIKSLFDKVSFSIAKFYDLSIPVTHKLAKELSLRSDRLMIFPGAMDTDCPYGEKNRECLENKDIIFAGQLERYNGVDSLLTAFSKISTDYTLHVYGKGTLEKETKLAADINENIVFHGFLAKEVVHTHMMNSKFNICLRFDNFIVTDYFFPSKFFSVNNYNGFVLVNRFNNMPEAYYRLGGILNDDYSNLEELISLNERELTSLTKKRHSILFINYSWSNLISK